MNTPQSPDDAKSTARISALIDAVPPSRLLAMRFSPNGPLRLGSGMDPRAAKPDIRFTVPQKAGDFERLTAMHRASGRLRAAIFSVSGGTFNDMARFRDSQGSWSLIYERSRTF